MATRFYFTQNRPAEVKPAASGTWQYLTEHSSRHLAHTTKSNTTLAEGAVIGPWTAGNTALDRIYVSAPLEGAQSISGTVKGYLMQREVAAADNAFNRLEIYVVSRDGTTVRGTCLAIGQYGPNVELNASLRSKALADGDSLTTVSAQDGDRIVVKVGYSDSAGGTPEAASLYGDPTSGTDLAENETNTTNNPGWIEFSGNFTFETNDGHPLQIVQSQVATSPDTQVTSLTVTPAVTPTVGNLLILIVNPDKDPTGITVPSGFATLPSSISWSNAETTCTVYYKVANGTGESSFLCSWTAGAGGNPRPAIGFLEISGQHATTPFDTTNFSASATTSTTRAAISVTPSTSMTGRAFFFATTDSIQNVQSGGYVWTNGTDRPDTIVGTFPTVGSPGNAALEICQKAFTSSSTAINIGCTYTGTADGGGIGAFIVRAAGGGGAMTGTTITGSATTTATARGKGALAGTTAGTGSALISPPGRMFTPGIAGTSTVRGNIAKKNAGAGTPTLVKSGSATVAGDSTTPGDTNSISVTFTGGTGAVAGNIIVAIFMPDKAAGTFNAITLNGSNDSGWTDIIGPTSNTSLSWRIAWKQAVGGEGATGNAIGCSWGGNAITNLPTAVILEYSGLNASSLVDQAPTPTYSETGVTAVTTPTATNTNANALALAIFGVDSGTSCWGNSTSLTSGSTSAGWAEIIEAGARTAVSSGTFDAAPGCMVASRVVASAGTSVAGATNQQGTQVTNGPALGADQQLGATIILNAGTGTASWDVYTSASTAGAATATATLGTAGIVVSGTSTATATLFAKASIVGSSAGTAAVTGTLGGVEVTVVARVAHVTHLRPVSETAPSLRYWAGSMTDTSFIVSCHAPAAGTVSVHVYNESTNAKVGTFTNTASGDFWTKITCTGLSPFTQYYYLIEFGARQAKGRVKTYQTPGTAQSFTFAAISCTLSDSVVESFARVKAKNADYLYNLGDMHYTDSGNGTAESVYLGEFDAVLQNATQMNMYSHYGFEYVWSDHDYGSPANSSLTSRNNAISAFKKAIPHTTLPFTGSTDPICRTWVNGRVRFIMTDTRSQRVAGTTFMGTAQKQWFKDQVTKAKIAGHYIIWLAEHNWNGITGSGTIVGSDDGYDTLAAERTELANFLKAVGVTGTNARFMIVHGDAHMIAIDDGTHADNDFATGTGANGIKIIAVGGLDRTGSAKGGPYSASGDTTNYYAPATTRHYGLISVTDSGGSTLSINLRCYDENDAFNTNVKELTFTTAALDASNMTANGAATVTGTMRAKAAISGTIAGVATTTATGRLKVAASGTIAGTSTVTGTLKSGMVGSVAGAATTTATLRGKGALACTAAGAATVTGTLTPPAPSNTYIFLTPESSYNPSYQFTYLIGWHRVLQATNVPISLITYRHNATYRQLWRFKLQGYAGGDFRVTLDWYLSRFTTNTGTMVWGVSVKAWTPGTDNVDKEAATFATVNKITYNLIGGLDQRPHTASVTLTNTDGLADGDEVIVAIDYLGDDAAHNITYGCYPNLLMATFEYNI